MASKVPEEHFDTETDEETVALKKKRLRRVSFADREITSVHIFNRDEDYETPPEDSGRKPSSKEDERQVLGFFRDLAADSDDFKDMSPGDNDEVVSRKSFFRPIESPSPGSSLIGSATSNDEDNFFGPVSASFIRHGRLSDSAASDDNHDITMDSTAFSMHFRSLVRSESGDLKTPTGSKFSFEEKTPTQVATSADPGSFMVLTKAKKPILQSPVAVGKVSGGRDSNDMSLVGDDPHRYDYARLSPALEALLAESGENMRVDSLFDSASETKSLKKSEVPISNDIGTGSLDLDITDNRDSDVCKVGSDDGYTERVNAAHSSLGEVNGGSTATVIDQISHDCLSSRTDDVVADAHATDHIQCPNHPTTVKDTFIEVVTGTSMPNIENPVGSSDNPPDGNGNSVYQLGLCSQHEPADLCSPDNMLKGILPAGGANDSHNAQLPDQNPESPLSGFITLSAKQKQIFLDTTNSSRHLPYVTPSPKQPGSFLRKENIKVGESMPSTRKSHSKFKIIGSSARTSALREEIEKSKRRLLEYRTSATSPVNNGMEEIAINLQFQHVDASIVNLEKHFFSADKKNEEHVIITDMNGDSSGTPMNCGSLNQNKMVLVKDGESLDHLTNLIPSEDKQTEMIEAAASPTQLTSPGKIQHLLMSNNPAQGALVVSVSNTSPVEVTLDQRKDQKATNDFDIFISPPMKSFDQKLSSLAETHGSLSGKLKQEVQCKSLVIDSRLDGNSIEFATNSNHLTGTADELDSLSVKERTASNSPLIEIKQVSDSTQEKRVDDRETYTSALQKASEMIKKFQILSGDMDLMKFQLTTPDKNLQIANDSSLTKGELPGEELKASPCVPTSPYVQRSVNEASLLKSPISKEPTWSPSRKEQGDSSLRNHTHFDRSVLSSKSNSDEHANDDCHQGLDNSLNPSTMQDFDNSSRGKRRSGEINLGDADNAYDINWIQRSLKVHKSGGTDLELMMEQSDGSKKGNGKIGGDTTMKHWTDISLRFSTQTNQILSPSIEKLNTRAIGMLEDILAHLLKVYKYEMLCSKILAQRTYDQSSNVGHNRLAEIRMLLYKIVSEKAMLEIARMKHEKLLKRGLLLDSGIQKFETLKLNYVRHLSASVKSYPQVDYNSHDSSLVNVGSEHEVARDNVTRMRQEVENLDGKTKNLVKSLHTYCKMKELSCADTIMLLNDNLKKRMCCRTIRQDLQLWKIDDLETKSSNQSLVLNYSGFICQRFTRIAIPVSSMVISNKPNDIKITKNFPNMNACVAFAFVFNAKSTKKSIGSKSLAQETQTTSALLRNLLAVVEEVWLARIENRNLIYASFNSPSAEKLDLQLSFIDFNSGRKVTMTLDVTSLNLGVYPSEIFPHHLEVSSARMQKSLPEELSSEIKATVSNLAIGYLRVIRLCRCVSQVVQLSSRWLLHPLLESKTRFSPNSVAHLYD